MRYFLFLYYCIFAVGVAFGQAPGGQELLDRCIAFHDPLGEWPAAQLELILRQELEDGSASEQLIQIDLPRSTFAMHWQNETESRYRKITGESCIHRLNGSESMSDSARVKHKLDCETTRRYRDYYVYLYGLPMKLKDPGTLVRDSTYQRDFLGKTCWVVTIDYEAEVGDHIWEIYIDPKTDAMIGYAFYKDPKTRKGEYISLSGEITAGRMRIPKDRTWYTYPEHRVLGVDELSSITPLSPR